MSTSRATSNSRSTASRTIGSGCAGDAAAAQAHRRAVTTLAEEKKINMFLRLGEPEVIERLRAEFPDLGDEPDARTVFLKLRELRNRW